MALSESDTRAKLIDPALHGRGWTEDLIRREETAGTVEIVGGRARKQARGRVDYTLRVRVNPGTQPIALALLEAKADHLPPDHGLEQAKVYGTCKRLNVRFCFSSNGHLFVEYDRSTSKTSSPAPLSEFPSPDQLRRRWEGKAGFSLESPAAKPLLIPYPGGEAQRRYYQDAAIRAVLEKLAVGKKHALISLATGAGKTWIAVALLKKIAEAGLLRRALFVCDREELRTQALGAFQNVFGADAAAVSGGKPQKNARILIATYQTLDVDSDQADANFLRTHYPVDYFSHIVIDECHRSAWGKWAEVLHRNPGAIQIGLTATPRELETSQATPEEAADQKITADNVRHFGEAVYEYDMAQGIEDGYLAACEIVRRDIFLDKKDVNERESLVAPEDLAGKKVVDARTGELAVAEDAFAATDFEKKLMLPERVRAMCRDLFEGLVQAGGPEQKTIVFCARDTHADAVASEMNNLYADWCAANNRKRADPYAFKCTASVEGSGFIADLRGASRHHFIATTVDLLTTGVDVPAVRNIVFFKYVRSPIAFYQMVGRGTRLDPPTGKLMFRVWDYTDATRLFGRDFLTKATVTRKKPPPEPPTDPPKTIRVEGFDVHVTEAGRFIVTSVDGRAMPVTVEEYKERLAAKLVESAPTLDQFRGHWIAPQERRALIAALPDGGRAPSLVRAVEDMGAFDLYDVLAELGYGLAPRTRTERADAFGYKNQTWLAALPPQAGSTLKALAGQFARGGTEEIENPQVFATPEVVSAGGLEALKALGKPAEILQETKGRLFAA
ncbi:MAG: DEAD/DEAH box helicase family protein [Acidobacteriota bacterium]|nr:DEAD/DEAH box helicase family protein [Acidobacteriota bacterium]